MISILGKDISAVGRSAAVHVISGTAESLPHFMQSSDEVTKSTDILAAAALLAAEGERNEGETYRRSAFLCIPRQPTVYLVERVAYWMLLMVRA